MKETGIIMSGNHPKLILDGIKTQTRRVIKPTKETEWLLCDDWDDSYIKDPGNFLLTQCPYGQVGDRLWVRETFCQVCFKEDGEQDVCYKEDLERFHFGSVGCAKYKSTSSIFMPRWASRITLEITEVRVERLQEINSYDLEREGCPISIDRKDEAKEVYDSELALEWFKTLWDSLNAKHGYGWEVNPFVWCISFKKLDLL